MLWNNNRLPHKMLAMLLALVAAGITPAAEAMDHQPQLLLNAQRLRRLKRDRERQTVRWVNFENRVRTAPDSTERGFELALYYAVTGDESRGREAAEWVLSHPSDRQAALVLDWCWPLLSAEQRGKLSVETNVIAGSTIADFIAARDCLFKQIATGTDAGTQPEDFIHRQLPSFEEKGFQNAKELYAACEYLSAVRAARRVDLREEASQFFSQLPVELLLGLQPEKLEHPDWITHIAALALVALDPNLGTSQYLQGWAIEDRQIIREGPGVAYEFMWADPYLPGVGYQNLDPWVYDPNGRLFARSSWAVDSCYVEISSQGVHEQNCPARWRDTPTSFGRLTLIPMEERCAQIPRVPNNETVIVWKLKPHGRIYYGAAKQQESSETDGAGMWRASANIGGKVCVPAR